MLRVELELLSVALFIMADRPPRKTQNIVVLPIDAMKFRVEHEHPQEPIFLLCAEMLHGEIKSSSGSSGDVLCSHVVMD